VRHFRYARVAHSSLPPARAGCRYLQLCAADPPPALVETTGICTRTRNSPTTRSAPAPFLPKGLREDAYRGGALGVSPDGSHAFGASAS